MPLEGGAGSGLRLHNGSEDEGGNEGYGEGIGHRLVMLFKGVVGDVEPQPLVDVAEEQSSHVVALTDDDGVFVRETAEVGKGGTEHRMGGDVAVTAVLIEVLEVGLHRSDVGEDALLRQMGEQRLEGGEGVFEADGVDEEFGGKGLDFFKGGESLGVVEKAKAVWVDVVDGGFVLETEEVGEERPHLSSAGNENLHDVVLECERENRGVVRVFIGKQPLSSRGESVGCSPFLRTFPTRKEELPYVQGGAFRRGRDVFYM